MRSKADKESAAERANYNFFDRCIHHVSTFQDGDLVYLDKKYQRLTSNRLKTTNAEELETVDRYELMFNKKGPLRVVKFHPHTIII